MQRLEAMQELHRGVERIAEHTRGQSVRHSLEIRTEHMNWRPPEFPSRTFHKLESQSSEMNPMKPTSRRFAWQAVSRTGISLFAFGIRNKIEHTPKTIVQEFFMIHDKIKSKFLRQ
jgi:hypothetical protein